VLTLADYDGPIRDSADFVIVGSGPGGALLAHTLASSGAKVIVVEAGPALGPDDFVRDVGKTLASYFWDGGARTSRGNSILPTLQARVLGGGSVFNSAICMRPLDHVMEKWVDDYGLDDFAHGGLDAHFDAVESFLGIKPADERVWGKRNHLFREACDKLGWSWEPTLRFEDGCIGSGECITGCRAGAKNSVDRRGIREFVEAGGTVYTSVQADELIRDGDKVRGIIGTTVDHTTWEKRHPVRITGACTIVCAGAINTPVLLRRSGFTREAIGSNLTFHPSCLVLGLFDEPVAPWSGATQGVHTAEHLERGIKLEALWATTSTFAMRLPKAPKQFKRYLDKFDHISVWDGWVSGEASTGKVRALPGGRPDIAYDIGDADVRRLAEATALLCDMYAAVGAREVFLGVRGLPTVMNPEEAARELRAGSFAASDLTSGSNHVMGTMPMGAKAEQGAACDAWGKVWGTEDCYVCDTSLYPSSPGVNPQLTAMALAHRLGLELPSRYGR
jgi:choline dehydrogenase-like flavoprotein